MRFSNLKCQNHMQAVLHFSFVIFFVWLFYCCSLISSIFFSRRGSRQVKATRTCYTASSPSTERKRWVKPWETVSKLCLLCVLCLQPDGWYRQIKSAAPKVLWWKPAFTKETCTMSDIAIRILVSYSVMNWQGQRHWIVAWLQNDTYR